MPGATTKKALAPSAANSLATVGKNYFIYFSKTALKKNLENHNYPAKILFNYLIQF